MKKLELVRAYLSDRTVGYIPCDDFFLMTLERKWLDNKRNESCIPEGTYIVKRDETGRHQWFAVQDVPGRSFIEMHAGQLPKHSDGCILVGVELNMYFNLDGLSAGLNALLNHVGDEDFMLTIRSYNPNFDAWPE